MASDAGDKIAIDPLYAYRFKELIDALEVSTTYNQKQLRHNCGTPACIAGHAQWLFKIERSNGEWYDIKKCLGMNYTEFSRMIMAHPFGPVSPTTKEAIDMLKRYVRTGRVEWKRLSATT